MRFSICCTSISPSTSPTSSSSRPAVSSVSSSFCLSARRTPRCAAMVSARRSGSSMPDSVCNSSGGSLRLVLTYCSNSDISERAMASTSRASRVLARGRLHARWPNSAPSVRMHFVDAHARQALHQHLDGAVGQLQQLQHLRQRADAHAGRRPRGRRCRRTFCATSRMRLSASIGDVQRADRLVAADEQRDDHVREHHHVAQRQHRQHGGFGSGLGRHVGDSIAVAARWRRHGPVYGDVATGLQAAAATDGQSPCGSMRCRPPASRRDWRIVRP